jgi:OPA family sugar phosphate sensor protein UhpC-like MFS transporter
MAQTGRAQPLAMPVVWTTSMLKKLVSVYKTGPNKPLVSTDPQVIAKRYERKRWSVFLTVTIGYGFFYICRLSLSVVKKPLIDAGIFDPAQLGTIGSALLFAYAFGRLTNGFLADRSNIRVFMSTGLFVSALINLALGFTTLFYLFVILWGINGWFQAMGSAPSVVSLTQWFSHSERGTRYGIWSISHCIGEGLTFAITAMVVSAWGWQAGFMLPGLVCVGVAIVMYHTHADRPQTYGLPPVADYKNDHVSVEAQSDGTVGKSQLAVLKNPWVWVLGLAGATMYVARYGINNWAIPFLQMEKGHSLTQAGFAASAAPIAGLFGSIASGIISDKLFNARRNWPTLLYGILQLASLFAFYLIPPGHIWLDGTALCFFGFATGGLLVFLGGLNAVDIVSKQATGAAMGMIGLFSYLGAGIQELVSGYLVNATRLYTIEGKALYNFDTAFLFWGGCSLLSICFALSTWKVKAKS